MNLRLSLLLALVLTTALTACNEIEVVEKPVRFAQTWTVTHSVLPQRSTYSGAIHARHEVDLAFRVSGKVIRRHVDVGSTVRKGQVLAELDTNDVKLNINSAKASLQAVKSEQKNAKQELNRTQKLFNQKFISKAILDGENNRYRTARSKVKAAQAQLNLVKNQAQYTQLIADSQGIITSVNLEIAQVIALGQSVFRLAKKGEYEVHIQVGEQAVKNIVTDMVVQVSLWSDADQWFDGKVYEVSPAASLNRTWLVKVTLLNPPKHIKLGMTAKVGFDTHVDKAVNWLPASALYQQDKKAAVWVVDDQQTVSLKPITLEKHLSNGVLISGLEGGTEVIAAGVHRIYDGQQINPIPYTGRNVPTVQKAN